MGIFDHKAVVASLLIPAFYHSCDIHGDIFLLIAFIGAQVFNGIGIHWFIIPVDLSGFPWMQYFMDFHCTFFFISCQGYQHQTGVYYHVTGLELRKYKLHKTSLNLVSTHCFQDNALLEIIFFIQGRYMGVLDILCFL